MIGDTHLLRLLHVTFYQLGVELCRIHMEAAARSDPVGHAQAKHQGEGADDLNTVC